MAHVGVIGGSITGLGCALALSQAGHQVTVLEADDTPLPDSPSEAWWSWDRKGAPQSRHTHVLLARLRNLLRNNTPDLHQQLLDIGAVEYSFKDSATAAFDNPEFVEGDDELVMLSCRRVTLEYMIRKYVVDNGGVQFITGARVKGLLATDDDAVPHVTGVLMEDGTERAFDVVADASGRRSGMDAWLEAIGVPALEVENESCGIFYTSRFYRLLDGAEYPVAQSGGLEGISIFDLPYMKGMVGRGDDRTFSITMCADPDDPVMRTVMKEPGFEVATQAIPSFRPWLEPDRCEPISPVHAMASIRNTRRHLIADGQPVVTGFIPVGDALMHTNPTVGLGCSLGWTGAWLLADALGGTDNPADLAAAYHFGVETEIVPWYETQVRLDRATVAKNAKLLAGEGGYWTEEDPGDREPSPLDLMRYGLRPAMDSDIQVLRRMLRRANLLDGPHEMFTDAHVLATITDCYHRRHEFPSRSAAGPSRDEMVALLTA